MKSLALVVSLGLAIAIGWADRGVLGQRGLAALIFTLIFAVGARLLRGVSNSGALAGAAFAFVIYMAMGWRGFLVLLSVFLVTWYATRLGYDRKQQLGTAERRVGRSSSQVAANLLPAGVMAWAATQFPAQAAVFYTAAIASLAEAAADTVSSEAGQALSTRVYLITSWQPVSAGTDGGISGSGTAAGFFAACVVAGLASTLDLISGGKAGLAVVAGTAGMMFDSLLGATLERRGWMNNDAVNLSSTAVAAALGYWLARL